MPKGPSALEQGALLSHVTWSNEEYCMVGRHGVSKITVDQVRGAGDFVDVARIVFDNGEGDLFAPLHMLTDFRLAPTQ
jgi:hypothetical protein